MDLHSRRQSNSWRNSEFSETHFVSTFRHFPFFLPLNFQILWLTLVSCRKVVVLWNRSVVVLSQSKIHIFASKRRKLQPLEFSILSRHLASQTRAVDIVRRRVVPLLENLFRFFRLTVFPCFSEVSDCIQVVLRAFCQWSRTVQLEWPGTVVAKYHKCNVGNAKNTKNENQHVNRL